MVTGTKNTDWGNTNMSKMKKQQKNVSRETMEKTYIIVKNDAIIAFTTVTQMDIGDDDLTYDDIASARVESSWTDGIITGYDEIIETTLESKFLKKWGVVEL